MYIYYSTIYETLKGLIMEEINKKKAALELEELEIRVSNLKKPWYTKVSFWLNAIPVTIAILGVLGQSYLSYEERLKANHEVSVAVKAEDKAKSEVKEIKGEVHDLEEDKDALEAGIIMYNEVLMDEGTIESEEVIKEVNAGVSDILLKDASDMLLKNTALKVLFSVPNDKSAALEMNKMFKRAGVTSIKEPYIPEYTLKKNEIVYYSELQLSYCKAVQALLKKKGYGYFSLRKSSGANDHTKYLKIYFAKR